MTLLDDLAKRLEQAELGVYTEDAHSRNRRVEVVFSDERGRFASMN